MTNFLVFWAVYASLFVLFYIKYWWKMALQEIYWSDNPLYILEKTDINMNEVMRHRGLY